MIYLPAIPGNSAEQLQFKNVSSESSSVYPGQDFIFSIKIYSNSGIKKFEYFLKINKRDTNIPSSSKLLSENKKEYSYRYIVKIPKTIKPGKYLGWIVATDKLNNRSYIPEMTVTVIPRTENGPSNSDTPQQFQGGEIKPLKVSERVPQVLKKSCDEQVGNCPKIESNSSLIDIEGCKVKDQTADFKVSNGFPRYPDAINGPAKLKILYMPFEFADKKFSEKVFEFAKREAKLTEEFLKRVSNGLVQVDYVFPERQDWVRFPEKNSSYLEQIVSGDTLINMVLEKGSYLKPYEYGAVFMVSPQGLMENNLDGSRNLELSSNGIRVPRVYFASGNESFIDPNFISLNLAHSTGHLLFFLEDIYNRDEKGGLSHPSGNWDIMGAGTEFFAWTMYLNGWFKDEQVDCLSPNVATSTHVLTPISKADGKKLIAIPTEIGKQLMIEYRLARVDKDLLSDGICNSGGCWANRFEGLVIYFLDTTINHLKGPISVPDKFYSKPMSIGEKITYRGYRIEFLAKGSKGAYVRVGKG